MKEFIRILRRFVPPYKKYLILSTIFNILSAILNIFSFSLIIPILQILFKMQEASYSFIPWDADQSLKDIVINNFYYYVTQQIELRGASTTLLILGLFLAVMTFMKTMCYFMSSATLIPIRTGIVRDIRVQLYRKLLSLPMGFFSEERKGDIIARMSGDVGEIENSIMSSLDMLFKNPILILFYFGTLVVISWQLTLFTLAILPLMGWIMGQVGKKLKRRSLVAQGMWSDLMSQLEETLGGLRIIKAFNAEKKMNTRFLDSNNIFRNTINKVNTPTVGTPHERVPGYGADCHCPMVWRYIDIEQQQFHHRPLLYLLSGDSLQRYQSVEGILKSRIQHTEGTCQHGTCG